MRNTMKNLCVIVTMLFLSNVAFSGYSSVTTSNYQFGSCGGISGGSAGGLFDSNNYSDKWSCLSDNSVNKCNYHASQIQASSRYTNSCLNWLNREIQQCANHMNSNRTWCNALER